MCKGTVRAQVVAWLEDGGEHAREGLAEFVPCGALLPLGGVDEGAVAEVVEEDVALVDGRRPK